MADIMSMVIPFLFVLAVVYGALEVSDIFKRKQVKLILSLCFGFVAMSTPFISSFIMGILPYAILAFVGFFFLGFALSFARGKGEGERDYTLIVLVLILVLLFLANYGYEYLENMFPGFSSENLITGVGLIIMLVIFYSVYRLWGRNGQ